MTEKLQNPFKINELITAVNSLVDSEGSSTPDNLSITQNTSSNLQTVGVINQNATTTAIKTWTGTKAQYDAITTKDNNTLYNITDDNTAVAYQAYTKSEVDSLIEALYPVGSIYIGTQSTCPLATLISGSTWVKVSEGRVLQGSDSGHSAGTTIEAGLPNITGGIILHGTEQANIIGSAVGCFQGLGGDSNNYRSLLNLNSNSGALSYGTAWLDASRSSSIYGNSNTVQPSAYVVNVWQRIA